MKIENAVVSVTAANRVSCLAATSALPTRRARTGYASARDSSPIAQADIQPLQRDVTKSAEIAGAAAHAIVGSRCTG